MHAQQTLAASVVAEGIGLHSGKLVRVELCPSEEDSGIVLERMDGDAVTTIPARVERVVDARLASTLGVGNRLVSTVEHLMAALWAAGVDNCRIRVWAPEIPVMDGSSAPWLQLIDRVGVVQQSKAREVLVVRRRVAVGEGDKRAVLSPGGHSLHAECSIAFAHPAIGAQQLSLTVDRDTFTSELAAARTFGFLRDVEAMQAAGLALGGSLRNAVVLDDARVLNPEGVRWADEFVRHKLLDAVGDLYLAGARVVGQLELHKSGHALHHALVTALLNEPGAVERVAEADLMAPVRRGRRSNLPAEAGALQAA